MIKLDNNRSDMEIRVLGYMRLGEFLKAYSQGLVEKPHSYKDDMETMRKQIEFLKLKGVLYNEKYIY